MSFIYSTQVGMRRMLVFKQVTKFVFYGCSQSVKLENIIVM
jgi:hypothetical protein